MSRIAIILGSDSDLPILNSITETLNFFEISFEKRVISAHRTPDILEKYVKEIESNGTEVVIAVAGMSAALPGVVAALTTLPVIGVPAYKDGGAFGGLDALLSIVQMPPGVPVAAVSVNGGKNAALLAVRILAINDGKIKKRLDEYIELQRKKVIEKDNKIKNI